MIWGERILCRAQAHQTAALAKLKQGPNGEFEHEEHGVVHPGAHAAYQFHHPGMKHEQPGAQGQVGSEWVHPGAHSHVHTDSISHRKLSPAAEKAKKEAYTKMQEESRVAAAETTKMIEEYKKFRSMYNMEAFKAMDKNKDGILEV